MRSSTLEVVSADLLSSERSRLSSNGTGKSGSGSILGDCFKFTIIDVLDTSADDWEEKHQEYSRERLGGSCFSIYYGFGSELLSGYIKRKREGKEKTFSDFVKRMMDHGKETEGIVIRQLAKYYDEDLKKCDNTYVGVLEDWPKRKLNVLCSPDVITEDTIYEVKCPSPMVARKYNHESTKDWVLSWEDKNQKPLCSAFIQACMYALAFDKTRVITAHCFHGLIEGETVILVYKYVFEESDCLRFKLYSDAQDFMALRNGNEEFNAREMNAESRKRGKLLDRLRRNRFITKDVIYLKE